MLFLLFLVLLFFLFSGVAGTVIVMASYGTGLSEVIEIINNPDKESIGIIKLVQAIQSVGLFIIPAFVASYFFSTNTFSYLKCNKPPRFLSILLVIVSMGVWIPAINFIAGLNARLNLPESLNFMEEKIIQLKESYNQLTTLFLDSTTLSDYLVNVAVMAVLPAVGEELLFRGVFQRLLSAWTKNVHWGIILSALLFSFFHFEFYGFLPRFMLGVLFGYLFAWTATIWIPILGHFINNFLIVSYYNFFRSADGTSFLDEIGTRADISLLISITGGTILLISLYFHEHPVHSSGR